MALRDVAVLDLAGLHPALRGASVILATDVVNPLTGPDGAAEVYGPQKGATPFQISELDRGLRLVVIGNLRRRFEWNGAACKH